MSDRHSVSASKSALLLSPCIRWAWSGAKRYDDSLRNNEKRDKGTLFHLMMDNYYRNHTKDNEKLHTEENEEVSGWYRKAVAWSKEALEPRCRQIHTEVYVGTNFATGDVHTDPTVQARNYPSLDGYVPGTADLVCVLSDESLLVGDWKTGGGTGAESQLLTLAYGLRKVYRTNAGALRQVRLGILYAGPERVVPVEWPVSESDMQSHADAMALQYQDVGVRTDAVPGIHCTQLYCPHLAYCPGITTIVGDAARQPKGLLQPEKLVRKKYVMSDTPESSEHAGFIMERVTAARRQLGYYEDCIRKYATEGGKVLAGDFEFKKTNSGFRWVKR